VNNSIKPQVDREGTVPICTVSDTGNLSTYGVLHILLLQEHSLNLQPI